MKKEFRSVKDFISVGKCGNVALTYKGACGKDVLVGEAYRCAGCGGWFHKNCIYNHFELEKKHDWGRKEERGKVLDEILSLLPKSGTTDSGYWIYEGKRVTYKQTIYASKLLQIIDLLRMKGGE